MKYTLIIMMVFLSFGCQKNTKETKVGTNNIEKLIKQDIDKTGMGMVKIEDFKVITTNNDSIVTAYHIFNNKMVNKEMKITRKYYLNSALDSILKKEDLKTEMKSEGDWVDMGF